MEESHRHNSFLPYQPLVFHRLLTQSIGEVREVFSRVQQNWTRVQAKLDRGLVKTRPWCGIFRTMVWVSRPMMDLVRILDLGIAKARLDFGISSLYCKPGQSLELAKLQRQSPPERAQRPPPLAVLPGHRSSAIRYLAHAWRGDIED